MLYFVSTPIGNLDDISLRAVNVLKSCDIIACEDTRHSKILLDHYNIQVKTIAYHKFNEKNSAEGIISLLKEGKNIAIISDAGMPVINDPGATLTVRLHEENIPYTIIPGANAGLCALILSGLDATKFAFFGFLSEKNKELKLQLDDISNFNGTRILYSSKYNINKDLESLYKALGEVKVAIVSEITKVHENTDIATLPFSLPDPKGEYVIIIDKSNKLTSPLEINDDLLFSEFSDLLKSYNKNDVIKMIKEKYSLPKSRIYNFYEKNKDKFT